MILIQKMYLSCRSALLLRLRRPIFATLAGCRTAVQDKMNGSRRIYWSSAFIIYIYLADTWRNKRDIGRDIFCFVVESGWAQTKMQTAIKRAKTEGRKTETHIFEVIGTREISSFQPFGIVTMHLRPWVPINHRTEMRIRPNGQSHNNSCDLLVLIVLVKKSAHVKIEKYNAGE
jgi:hypothetical protein